MKLRLAIVGCIVASNVLARPMTEKESIKFFAGHKICQASTDSFAFYGSDGKRWGYNHITKEKWGPSKYWITHDGKVRGKVNVLEPEITGDGVYGRGARIYQC